MWRFYYYSHHPIAWIIYGLLIVFLVSRIKSKKLTAISAVFFILFVSSMTPTGSSFWIESIPYLTATHRYECGEIQDQKAILLPGGFVYMSGQRRMTQWSENRVIAMAEAVKQGRIGEIIIPGGYWAGKKLEGERLKEELQTRIGTALSTYVGSGSTSTNGNFSELKAMVDGESEYVLYTSNWHAFRAIRIAKKHGIQACFVPIKSIKEVDSFVSSSWRLKAAVREYMAIVWYWLNGWI